VLWKVRRDGHCNVNQEELQAAFAAVVEAVEDKETLSGHDGTRPPKPGRSPASSNGAGLKSNVQEVDEVYGNLVIGYQPSDFARLGIQPGKKFHLHLGSVEAEVLYGHTFADVPKGHWVAFPTGEGWVMLSKNFESAAAASGVMVGAGVQIRL
jgi:S-adenosylmethionine hydrolase